MSLGLEFFVRLSGIFDFLDARGARTAPGMGAIYHVVVHLLIRVNYRGDDFLLVEAQQDEIVVAFVPQYFRTRDVRLEVIHFVVVVLHERERLRQRRVPAQILCRSSDE